MPAGPIKLHHHHHDADAFVREVEASCAERELRLTPLRREVLELVAASTTPVKAYELLDRMRDNHANVAPPTVYRALDFLLENRFIHKLESINAYTHCEHPAQSHQVPFLICDVCDSAVEVCDPHVAELIERQADSLGFRAGAKTLEVHGVCRNCQQQ
ncbi:MAG TPA: Fur family transcriptional regulator [Rhodanobacteraceae bacterium]|nr:Fur family transcriptional regulator [Rhodanobacteraceae bacterium]